MTPSPPAATAPLNGLGTGDLQQWLRAVPAALRGVVQAMDDDHPYRVAALSACLAGRVGVDPQVAAVAGFLHDVGKLRIPSAVINKPGRLTDEEYRVVQRHVLESVNIILELWPDAPPRVVEGVVTHHERLDGRGYPFRCMAMSDLAGVIAVADVYDALTSHRPYRNAFGRDAALAILEKESLPLRVVQALVQETKRIFTHGREVAS